jgi:hypothetical protein
MCDADGALLVRELGHLPKMAERKDVPQTRRDVLSEWQVWPPCGREPGPGRVPVPEQALAREGGKGRARRPVSTLRTARRRAAGGPIRFSLSDQRREALEAEAPSLGARFCRQDPVLAVAPTGAPAALVDEGTVEGFGEEPSLPRPLPERRPRVRSTTSSAARVDAIRFRACRGRASGVMTDTTRDVQRVEALVDPGCNIVPTSCSSSFGRYRRRRPTRRSPCAHRHRGGLARSPAGARSSLSFAMILLWIPVTRPDCTGCKLSWQRSSVALRVVAHVDECLTRRGGERHVAMRARASSLFVDDERPPPVR